MLSRKILLLLPLVLLGLGQAQVFALRLADPTAPLRPPTDFSGDVYYDRYDVGTDALPENVFQGGGVIVVGSTMSIINGKYSLSGGKLSTQVFAIPAQQHDFDPWWPGGIQVIDAPIPATWTSLVPREPEAENPIAVDPLRFDPLAWEPIILDPFVPLSRREQKFHQTGGEFLAQDAIDLNNGSIILDEGKFTGGVMTVGSAFTQNGGTSAFDAIQFSNGIASINGGTLGAKELQVGTNGSLVASRWDVIPISPFPNGQVDDLPIQFPTLPPTETSARLLDWSPPTRIVRTNNRLHQTSGEIAIQEAVRLGRGSIIVDNGRFTATSLVINGSNSALVPTEFQQNGGTTSFESILIDDGHFLMNGGVLQAKTLAMGEPAADLPSFRRRPAFTQAGGQVIIENSLELCIPGSFQPFDPINIVPFESVDYRLQGGTLSVGGDLIVGSMGAAPARFTHEAGDNQVTGTLRIEGPGSVYELISGSLDVGRLHVATDVFNNGGRFFVGPEAIVHIREEVVFGEDALFLLPGNEGAMVFSGTSFSIQGSDPMSMIGLDALSLVVLGNEAAIEVAGQDFGHIDSGFESNFSLNKLQVGNEEAAHARLVDLIENVNSVEGSEALYVDTLELSDGSTLELNGLNIYYRELSLGAGAKIVGSAMAVPEPGGWILSVVGILAVGIRRRRRR